MRRRSRTWWWNAWWRGPEMFMDPAEKESARKVALEESVTDAVAQGLSVSEAERLRGILSRRFNAFRLSLIHI